MTDPRRESFRASRQRGIGGSDVAAIMGLSPFSTPLDVWRAKVLGDDDGQTPAMERGIRFEPHVLRAYAAAANAMLQQVAAPFVKDWRIGNVDMMAQRNGWPRVVEAKTTAFDDDWGEPGTDEVPVYYQTQALWYLDLAEMEECDLPVLVMPRDPRALRDMLGLPPQEIVARIGVRVYSVQFNAAAVKHIVEECRRFWHEHVLPQVPPAPRDLADAKRCWWSVEGKAIEGDDAMVRALLRYDAIREAEKQIDAEKDRVQFELRTMLGDAEAATFNGRRPVTCKTTKRADGVKFRSLRTTKDWEAMKTALPALTQETKP